jgi:glucan phosphorylase
MKAVLNGVPSLSILDGWWIEGCIEGVPGWAIGELPDPGEGGEDRLPRDAASLYETPSRSTAPLLYAAQGAAICHEGLFSPRRSAASCATTFACSGERGLGRSADQTATP